MQFINPTIDRIIIHQIFKREKDKRKPILPVKSTEYTDFDDVAMADFRSRVTEALGENTKAVEMDIKEQDEGSLSRLINTAFDEHDDDFIDSSFEIAEMLHRAQNNASYPGGIVVVFTGTCNIPNANFVGIIKAEIHSAYQKHKNPNTNKITLQYIKEVLLTPSARLYKTAAFLQKKNYELNADDLNKNWEVWVSDYQINQSEGKAAAKYFYDKFLGLKYPNTNASKTKIFFEASKEFIFSLEINAEEKNDYINALISYIKVNTSSIISPIEFSESYLKEEIREDFIEKLEDSGLTRSNFHKDIDHIKNSLKQRKVFFNNDIKLTASPEIFKEKISLKTIDGTPDNRGNTPEWTQIIIKEKIINQ